MIISDIVANIERRLAELDAELAQLTDARAALLDGAPPTAAPTRSAAAPTTATAVSEAPTTAAVSRPRRRSRAVAKPRYEVVPAGKLIALLCDSPGMRTRELAQVTNGNPGQVLALLKEQENAGQVRRSGTRAATRWHVITDEDRIAARAAELRAATRPSRARKT